MFARERRWQQARGGAEQSGTAEGQEEHGGGVAPVGDHVHQQRHQAQGQHARVGTAVEQVQAGLHHRPGQGQVQQHVGAGRGSLGHVVGVKQEQGHGAQRGDKAQ